MLSIVSVFSLSGEFSRLRFQYRHERSGDRCFCLRFRSSSLCHTRVVVDDLKTSTVLPITVSDIIRSKFSFGFVFIFLYSHCVSYLLCRLIYRRLSLFIELIDNSENFACELNSISRIENRQKFTFTVKECWIRNYSFRIQEEYFKS